MKRACLVALACVFFLVKTNSQTPINMSAQSGLTYTEDFSDISNWIFDSLAVDGNFLFGIGAFAWKGNAVSATGSIPSGTKLTTATTKFVTQSSGGVQVGTKAMVLLSTSTTDNTTSAAMDFFMDFTGVNAGTLSFDWKEVNNSTGDRNGSLRVYASTDGSTFTEITSAQVLNFTNNIVTSGSIVNVALPSSFNNSATARLRFYYHNGTGGTTGSRPKASIDNVKVTATSSNGSCTTPTTQPTAFAAGTITNTSIQASFTNANPAPQNYLVIASNNSSLSSNPVNGVNYAMGDNVGDGSVVAFSHSPTFAAQGLNPNTTYYFFIYAMNSACTGGPLYNNTNPLTGNATTLAGSGLCQTPANSPTSLVLSNITSSSIKGSFTAVAGTDEYVVVRSISSSLSSTPSNKTIYNAGDALGGGTVVARSASTSFSALGLNPSTQYYFYIFSLNSLNCNNGPTYKTASPLTADATTTALPVCAAPTAQPTLLNLSASNTSVNGYFTASSTADTYLVVRSTSSTLSSTPVNNTTYNVGSSLGNGIVISNSSATSFVDDGLNAATTYYYFVFAENSVCTGGVKYLTISPLTKNTATTSTASYNYYFGNLHSHSSYSDGNQDNTSLTPANDYAYAKNSLCMDFLGISEHNHSEAGLNISNWQPGITQANAATTSNFLALHGMEWGVISGGGHVLVYGTDQLIGWESSNYNVFVAKSDYTGTVGLFRTLNGLGGFASYAHPQTSDYNNILNTSFNAAADSVVIGCAVESGPSTSTSTSYNDLPSSYGFLPYYTTMLAKGYHIGPFMDQDTHKTNFGRANYNRLCVLSSTLTKTDFFAALKARHFYATEDCDTRVNFTLNNQMMGSIISGSTTPAISIYAIDPTNTSATPTIKLMYGIPGSNVVATQIASVNGNTLSYTDISLADGVTGYYYADITIAGNRTMSAPIWYTKTSALPVTLVSLSASLNNNHTVNINWVTANEVNNKLFVVEKSVDGVNFTAIDSVAGKGNSSVQNNYSSLDKTPVDGLNYYRLKQIDNNGSFVYSNIVSVDIKKTGVEFFSVFPNPANNILNLNINSKSNAVATLSIFDMSGRLLLNQTLQLNKGNQILSKDISKLNTGTYFVSLTWNDQKVTDKLIKL
jgi:hypothetical protein